jgi:hypothetical protein
MDDQQRRLPAPLSREVMQRAIYEFARMGGRARAANLSAERRRAIAKNAVAARNRRLSKHRRQEIARQAARARWDARPESQDRLVMVAEAGAGYGLESPARSSSERRQGDRRRTSKPSGSKRRARP